MGFVAGSLMLTILYGLIMSFLALCIGVLALMNLAARSEKFRSFLLQKNAGKSLELQKSDTEFADLKQSSF